MPGKRTVAAVTEQTEDQVRKNLLRKAYTNATQALREAHREDFDRLYQEHADALGVDWHPRPNAEQKAQAQFEELVTAYPYLLDRVRPATEPEGEPTQG